MHSVPTVVLSKQLNFKSAVIRSNRSSCLVIVGREMFLGEMSDDLPDRSKKTKILAKMARMTRMPRTVARMARWLADLADPSENSSLINTFKKFLHDYI